MGRQDALVLVPGIMGSELVDVATGTMLWGLRDPRWYARAWTSQSSLRALKLTDQERAGNYGRIRPGRLLRFPAFAPVLRGLEPYTKLISALRSVAMHPDAVREFPYDWRLPVTHNASLLARKVDEHLNKWRRHPALTATGQTNADPDDVKVVVIAHSMGGLLAQHMLNLPEISQQVRRVITLGTPFHGAPKAVLMLGSGRGTPVALPRHQAQKLAVTLPAIYDLLPTYRCWDQGTSAQRLEPADIESIGGDRELAAQAARRHELSAKVSLPRHVQVAGAYQPTVQAIALENGVAQGLMHSCLPAGEGRIERTDLGGDGTVPRESAQLQPSAATPLAQSHGALAKSSESLVVAIDAFLDRLTGPWQGATMLGLKIPESVCRGESYVVTVTGTDKPRHVRCQVTDVATNRCLTVLKLQPAESGLQGQAVAGPPGLVRIEVKGGGSSPVSEVMLVV